MILEKLTAVLEWEVDARALNEFDRQTSAIANWGAKIARMASIAAGALTALGGVMLKETATNIRLAESVGMSADNYLAWEGILKHVGFEGEKVIDLVEEMTNKIGEMKGLGDMTSVRESLRQLNIEFGDLKQLAPEDQFMTILEAAKALDDEQIAASAVDMLMGGEANRIVGLLRTYDGTVADIISTHRKLNMITDKGIAGAMAWSIAWDNMTTSASSLFTELAGRAGAVMVPYINHMLDWVAANRELVDQKIESVINGIASAMRWLAWAGEKVAAVVEKLGGFASALKLTVLSVGSWKAAGLLKSFSDLLPEIMKAAKGTNIFKAALKLLGKTPLVALLTAAALAIEDLYVYLTGGKSLFGEWTKTIGDVVDKGLLRWIGAIRELTDAEKEAYREANHLADSVDIQDEFDDQATAAFRQKFMDSIFAIEQGLDNVATGASLMVDSVTSTLGNFVDGVQNVGAAMWESISSTTSGIVDTIAGGVSSAFDSVVDYITGSFADGIVGMMDWLASTVGNGVSIVVDVFKNGIDSILGAFNNLASSAWDTFSGVAQTIIDTIAGAFQSLMSTLSQIPVIGSLFDGKQLTAQVTHMHKALAPPMTAMQSAGAASNSIQNNVDVSSPITVTMTGSSATPQNVAQEVARQIGEHVRDAVQRTSSGVKR